MSLHDKHRERMDRKVCENGLEDLEPHEQLEYILYAVIPRGNTNEIAHNLLDRYKTVAAVLSADPKELQEVDGVGRRCSMFLTTLPSVLRIVDNSLKSEVGMKFDTIEKIVEHATTLFYGKIDEEAYLFCLSPANELRSCKRISKGAQDEMYLHPTQVVRRAIRDNAYSAILVHNHPCGEANPSSVDVTLSRDLARAFDAVEIIFADSVIIAGDKHFSMREKGYLDNLYEKNYRMDKK